MIRVRFAPSPTGYLHVGGARTALFNWLFARHHGGIFVLRIEDTDVERSSWDMVEGILAGMRWLGMDWDEGPEVGGAHGPYFQSQRLARYRELAERLVATGHAYHCYCDPDALKAERGTAQQGGEGYKYDRRCLELSPESIAAYEAEQRPRAIRFKMPPGVTRFSDLVKGDIEFANDHIEDFVILRSDGHPTYHLSVVADDVDMEITHVVRGDDHVSNTPKQVLLYEALGAPVPRFAHVPLILGPDKKRLSKRHGATSVTEYERQGVLPQAMFNFLALLGWNPGTEQEVFTREELVEAFTLEKINASNAVFNPEKLEWFNAQHLARLGPDAVMDLLEPALRGSGLWRESFGGDERTWLLTVFDLLKSRLKQAGDFPDLARPYLLDEVEYDEVAASRHFAVPGIDTALARFADVCATIDPFDAETLEATLRGTAEAQGLKAGALIHATRLAVTGRGVSPSLFDVLVVLGRDRVVTRLRAAASHVAAASTEL